MKDNQSSSKSPETDQADGADENKKSLPPWLGKVLKIGGIVVAIMLLALITLVAGVSLHYWKASDEFDLSKIENLEAGALVLDARGERIGRIGSFDRVLVTSDELPEHFVEALIVAEDQRFHSHSGFDLVGMTRAAITNYRSGTIREGASTVTQQLARNVYSLKGKSMDRKLLEIALAARIESRYSKEEILEHYLNRIYFGSGCYGVGSAANRFFGKKVSELTVAESALICGVIRSPSRLSPFEDPRAAIASRNRTLTRMAEVGVLSPEELARELGRPTPITGGKADHQRHQQRRYILTRVEKEARRLLDGRGLEGLTIQTSVDLDLQLTGVANLNHHLTEVAKRFNLSEEKASHLQGAIMVLNNATGDVVASIGSRDYSRSQFDRAWDLKRPPGSAFFPLVYAAAFEQEDFDPDSKVLDGPVDNREVMVGGVTGVLGEWSTEDPSNRWEGNISAERAFRKSKNSPTVRVGFLAGIDNVRKTAADLGIASELRPYPGTFLGASEVGLVELVRAYTAIANDGKPVPRPSVIRAIKDDEQGKMIYTRSTDSLLDDAAGVSKETAQALKSMMRLTESGQSAAAVSGKSGTTSNYTDAWFVGFSKHHTWGIWIGMDEFDTISDNAFGGDIARPVWEGMISGVLIPEPSDDTFTGVEAANQSNQQNDIRLPSSAAVKDVEVAGKAGATQ